MNSIKVYQSKLDQLIGKKANIEQKKELLKTELKDKKKELIRYEQAKEVIKTVGLKTQQSLQYHISDITSLAMEAVFDNPYKVCIEFVERRNKTECDIHFERNEEKINPLTSSGGGTVDVASFALRIACWSMRFPNYRPVIILDEPMRFLSNDNQEKASNMIKQLSEKLGLQFIIVTHEPNLALFADKIFETRIKKGITTVKTSNNDS